MDARKTAVLALALIFIGNLLLAFGHEFLMAQRPIDFAHWSLLLGACLSFSLWFCLPANVTKRIGLSIMTLGIPAMIGMCVIDFLLWSMGDDLEAKQSLFGYIDSSPMIRLPFLMVGPAMFYVGLAVSTYGLIKTYPWQVILLNVGALLIGLGLQFLRNGAVAAAGGLLLLIGFWALLYRSQSTKKI